MGHPARCLPQREGIDDSHVERVTETKTRRSHRARVQHRRRGCPSMPASHCGQSRKALNSGPKWIGGHPNDSSKSTFPCYPGRPGAVRMPVRHGGTAHSEEHTFRRGEIRKLHAPVRTRRRCRLCGCGRQRQHLRFRRFADSPEHGFRAGAWHDDSTFVAVVPAIPRSEPLTRACMSSRGTLWRMQYAGCA